MKRTFIVLLFIGLGTGILFSQSINLKIGLFSPSLRSDLWSDNMVNLAFNKTDLLDMYCGAEYEFFFSRRASFSLEIGSYAKEVYSQYRDYTDQDDRPIFQNLSLRISPIEANLKFYPLGHRHEFFPYFGIGVGVYGWTYQQYGDFIIFPEGYIEEGFAETDTFSIGLNARVGFVYRFLPRLGLTLEAKYQYVRGQLSGYFEGFELLDLGGVTATVGLNFYLR